MAQQKAKIKKNGKAKKAANGKAQWRQALEIEDKAEKERPATSFSDQRPKKPLTTQDKLFDFGAPSLNADNQAIDETLTPVTFNDKPKPAKVNCKVANDQDTKAPVMPTTFLSHPYIKTFDPNDINLNFDEAEDA